MQRGCANDLILLTLAVHGPLTFKQLTKMLGVTSEGLSGNVGRLQARGLLTKTRVVGQVSRRGVLLDARHAGAVHLAAYLTDIAAVSGAPALAGIAPKVTDDVAPFPPKPANPLGHPARNNMLLALSLSPELKLSELVAICGRNSSSAFKELLRVWRLRGFVRPTQHRGADFYTALEPSLPGATHLRRFLKATAVAYYPRLVLSARVILRDAFSAD